jgi:hypothetical protein
MILTCFKDCRNSFGKITNLAMLLFGIAFVCSCKKWTSPPSHKIQSIQLSEADKNFLTFLPSQNPVFESLVPLEMSIPFSADSWDQEKSKTTTTKRVTEIVVNGVSASVNLKRIGNVASWNCSFPKLEFENGGRNWKQIFGENQTIFFIPQCYSYPESLTNLSHEYFIYLVQKALQLPHLGVRLVKAKFGDQKVMGFILESAKDAAHRNGLNSIEPPQPTERKNLISHPVPPFAAALFHLQSCFTGLKDVAVPLWKTHGDTEEKVKYNFHNVFLFDESKAQNKHPIDLRRGFYTPFDQNFGSFDPKDCFQNYHDHTIEFAFPEPRVIRTAAHFILSKKAGVMEFLRLYDAQFLDLKSEIQLRLSKFFEELQLFVSKQGWDGLEDNSPKGSIVEAERSVQLQVLTQNEDYPRNPSQISSQKNSSLFQDLGFRKMDKLKITDEIFQVIKKIENYGSEKCRKLSDNLWFTTPFSNVVESEKTTKLSLHWTMVYFSNDGCTGKPLHIVTKPQTASDAGNWSDGVQTDKPVGACEGAVNVPLEFTKEHESPAFISRPNSSFWYLGQIPCGSRGFHESKTVSLSTSSVQSNLKCSPLGTKYALGPFILGLKKEKESLISEIIKLTEVHGNKDCNGPPELVRVAKF